MIGSMRRKATTIFASLLVLWALSSALIPSGGWTFYTPYSSYYSGSAAILDADTATKIPWQTATNSGWTLLLIGCILVTLMQAPKRTAIVALLSYGLAALVHFGPIGFVEFQAPRRYHYYYFAPESQSVQIPYGLIALLLLTIGLLISVIPPLYQAAAKRSSHR